VKPYTVLSYTSQTTPPQHPEDAPYVAEHNQAVIVVDTAITHYLVSGVRWVHPDGKGRPVHETMVFASDREGNLNGTELWCERDTTDVLNVAQRFVASLSDNLPVAQW
jgi:hypothetical protein